MAQSMARLVNFWNDHPAWAGRGMRISVSSSPGSSDGLEQALEELPGGDLAAAGGAARDQRGVEHEDHRRQVARGVGVHQRAADRAAVADLRVADLAGGVGEQRQLAAEQAGVRHVVMGGEGPDRDVAVLLPDVGELAEPADVDQHLGHGQPELHEREQRVPAGQEFRVLAALRGQAQGLVHRPGPLVGEGCGDHRRFPPFGRGEHGPDDVVVAGAPAQVALQPGADLAPRWAGGSPRAARRSP